MRIFHFIARHVSYTFAVCFLSIMTSWVLAVLAFFLGTAFIIVSYEKLSSYFIRALPIAVAIPTFLHYLHFGLLTPLKIPAFSLPLREVNRAYKQGLEIPSDDLKRVYGYFSDLPMHNLIAAALYTAVAGLIIIIVSAYEYYLSGKYSLSEIQTIIKVTSLTVIIIMILYGMATYLVTEALTNDERVALYNRILQGGEIIRPRSLIGIRLKFVFFVWLMVISLLTFAALMEKTRYSERYDIWLIAAYIIASAVASLFLMFITTGSIMRILRDLIRVTRAIASGGSAGYQVLSLEREFTAIELALMETAQEINDYRRDIEGKVAQRTKELEDAMASLRSRDEQIQKQLDMASVIQRSILPGRIEDWNEITFAVRYYAMEKIGGDFYDVQLLKGDKIGVMIADVSGHGIPAALVTTMAKMSFGNAGGKYDSPRKIFQEMNQSILEHVKTQDYLTCFMLSIDDEYNVVYSNASHQKALLLRGSAGTVEHLDTGGLFIGAVEEARDTYEEKRTKLEYGDRIILYTDGIPEAINEVREEYSIRRLEESVIRNRHLGIEEFADAIIDDVRRFIGRASVVDDITCLVIELKRDEAVDIIKNAKRLIAAHRHDEAVKVLEKGIAAFPDNQKIRYNLAKAYFRVNEYRKAADTIERYLQDEHLNKNAYYIGGAAYYQLDEIDRSIALFEKAVELDPIFVNALFAAGMAHKKKGNRAEAARLFERVLSVDPDNRMALFEIRSMTGAA